MRVLVLIHYLFLGPALFIAAAQQAVPGSASTPEGEGLRDVAPPVLISEWTPKAVAAAIAGGLLAAAFLTWAFRAWLRRPRPLPVPESPSAVAMRALDALAGQEGRALSSKEFSAAVSRVIRRFLEAQHGIEAPKQTTEEFLELAERSNKFAGPVREQLRSFLGRCDELKFAPPDAVQDAREQLLNAANRLVREDLA
jgi:hypothetical protein